MTQISQEIRIPLTSAQPGRACRLCRIEGGRGLKSRLCAMGLTPGVPVERVGDSSGPVVLRILGSRVMIGRNIARRILVTQR
ncbi:MAG: ferrous iron transport protein A [Phycisphaerae bacterium]